MGDLYLNERRYQAALSRIKSQIEADNPLTIIDNDSPGEKDTQVSWGLCSSSPEQWPDAEDHMFTHRPSPKYRTLGQHCPFDEDQDRGTKSFGCYYRCRIFQGQDLPSKAEALQLYTATIERHLLP